jgi:hypothetical protein
VLQFTSAGKRHGAEKSKVAGGKSVWLSERAHRHVLCRPFPNARNFTQATQENIGVHDAIKCESSIAHRPSESADGRGSRAGQSDVGEFGVGKNLGCGEYMGEAIRRRRRQRFSKAAYQSAS